MYGKSWQKIFWCWRGVIVSLVHSPLCSTKLSRANWMGDHLKITRVHQFDCQSILTRADSSPASSLIKVASCEGKVSVSSSYCRVSPWNKVVVDDGDYYHPIITIPGGPCWPLSPLSPTSPLAPGMPVGPSGPLGPWSPILPGGPTKPFSPTSPA